MHHVEPRPINTFQASWAQLSCIKQFFSRFKQSCAKLLLKPTRVEQSCR